MKSIEQTQGSFAARYMTIVLAATVFCISAFAQPAHAAQTSTYVFLTDQSTVVKTGGFAGVNIAYPIQGQFQLEVDADAGVASFAWVNAFLLSPISSSPPQSLGDVFNMTGLNGVIIDDKTIRFEGKTDNENSVSITLTFSGNGNTVTLKGGTTPPPNSADFFIFNLDVQAARTDQTQTYVFDPAQSTVLQTGGIAGLHRTYTMTGTFVLTLDFEMGTASFDRVDANAVDNGPYQLALDPNDVFDMTALAGVIIDRTTIRFEGTAADGSSVLITLNFTDDSISLKGGTTPPPNSADFFIFSIDAVAQRKYSGGTGDPNDPYQIATATDLIALGETPEDYDKHFILTADIDLDPNLPGRKVFKRAVIAPDTNDATWAFEGTSFTGVFDGGGHTISHLVIKGESCLGLVGQLDYPGMISNLGLEVADVNGAGYGVGGLVGLNNSCTTTSYSSGTVTGLGLTVGGLVGDNSGSINACHSTCSVKHTSELWIPRTSSAPSGGVGGLVGYNSGCIIASYSTSTVEGMHGVGGLVGYNGDDGRITAGYSTGGISGDGQIGGLVGCNTGNIATSYSTGAVTGNWGVGGLVGNNSVDYGEITVFGNITSSFWDIETSKQSSSAGGIGLTTVEMQTARTFLDAGWDFAGEMANGTEDIWSICEGTNYPRLTWQIRAGDVVCPDGITIDDFVFFIEHWLNSDCDSDNNWCDGTDLDCSGAVDIDDLEILLNNWPADSQ